MADKPDLTLPVTAADLVARVNEVENDTSGRTVTASGGVATFTLASDLTAPVPGTLEVTELTETAATLTVTGASDETALHAEPYTFSRDNGQTWSPWQPSASLTMTGLTAATSYEFQHKVRDAAGNEASGVVQERTTPDLTLPTPGTLAASDVAATSFTLTVTGASDNVALHATPYAFSTDNGATWSAWQGGNVFIASGRTQATTYQAQHKVRDAALNEATGTAVPVTTLTLVTATAPTFTDEPGTASDTYTIPTKTGVEYLVDGGIVAAGTYPGTGTVTVTAQATTGYELQGTSSWSHTYSTV